MREGEAPGELHNLRPYVRYCTSACCDVLPLFLSYAAAVAAQALRMHHNDRNRD